MAVDNSTLILAVSWTETCIGLFLFSLPFLSNWKFVGRFRWDFAVAGLTVATETTAQVFLQFSVNAGMGHHLDELSDSQRVTALHWSWVFQLLAITASMLGKLAILAFLFQIRGRHDKKPWFLIILGVLIGSINIAVLGTILGQCKPMHKLWDDSVEGTCDPGRKMNQNYSFFQANAQSSLLIWASTESWIMIIVGCVPPIRSLMEKVMQRLGFTSKKTSTPYEYRNSSGRAAYGTNKSNLASHTHFQSNAYGGRKSFEDDPGWMELTTSGGTNGSKEHIVNTQKDVMVRTDIVTRFEDVEGQGPSSGGSNISSEDIRERRDVQKVV
ncbi:hypothetical protein N7463_004705 [Penicillium fimorum]|uniref:Rhodopsin domain-containing protein n=1 Tax=Penicillium fimorum TaxID=1882269 RepID=A0A9W9Y3J6_9EURO|nr:hypothetical protein N7463_004705 [Penicillium fimorum]